VRKLIVFLCHSSEDKPVVKTLYKQLCNEDIDPWLDEEKLLPGENWDLEIRKAVKSSDIVIVCLSDQSVRKEGYVQREIKYALEIAEEKPEGTIFIIPIKLNECGVPSSLSKYQWVDFFDKDAYKKVLRSLRKRAEHLKESGQEIILPKVAELPSVNVPFTSPSIEQKRQEAISYEQQKRLMYETLVDLERYLDTSDLRKLTFDSLAFLKEDILKIIEWLKDIEDADRTHRFMISYSGATHHLRRARSNLQAAQGMFGQEYLDEGKASRFFDALMETRKNIVLALRYFGIE